MFLDDKKLLEEKGLLFKVNEESKRVLLTGRLQRTLRDAGIYIGPVDGVWSERLEEAVKRLIEQKGIQ
jgi:peptidoglycan hydrolase-like protein with peptidoglycan-binding domain